MSSESDREDQTRSRRHSSEERTRQKRKSRRDQENTPPREARSKRERRESPQQTRPKQEREESPARPPRRRRDREESRSPRRPREQDDASPRDSRRRRARSRSPPDDGAVARRYWGSRNQDRSPRREAEPSNDRFPLGDRYYGKTEADVKAEPPPRKPQDMLNTRTGGAYIPPARLRMMQAQITDKSTAPYQRIAWEALKKSIHGHINKINVGNIGIIIKQLLKENIVRGRGLLCRSIIQAQAASPTFTNVYAALVAAVNSRFPNVGELLLKRLVIQFKRGFKRNDKAICISAAIFIAHLVNQRVAHEILALELLTLLVETPTDDSVEVAIAFLKECGQKLTEVSSKGVNAIFEMLRNILHEGALDKRVQYMIEVIFQVWKDGFKDHPAVIEELELVPEEEQFTHLMMLDEATDAQDILNVFKLDEKYEENEQKYKDLSKEILGSDAESGDEEASGSGSGSEESDDEGEQEETKKEGVTIIDNTETNLIALRRTIYLTINSSLDFEECAHKLMKMQLKPGQEIELCHMFLDCCAEQRTYEKFYGLLAQRFCQINKIYISPFEEIFKDSYGTAHRLDTNRLRNVSKFFAHLLFTDSISWEVLECVKLNEEDTTSSSRIYIKILFQELAEYMGLKKLNDRLRDVTLHEAFRGLFPRDNPKNTRFSINFFTSIGLGGLTDDLREHLKQLPKNAPQLLTEINVAESSSSSSSSSSSDSSSSQDSSSSSSSDSDSEEEGEKTREKKNTDKHTRKNKSPLPDKETSRNKGNERWGHDGFYETYGKDAVRESRERPKRREREESDDFRKRTDGSGIQRESSVRRHENTSSYWNQSVVNEKENDHSKRNDKEKSERRKEKSRLSADRGSKDAVRESKERSKRRDREESDDLGKRTDGSGIQRESSVRRHENTSSYWNKSVEKEKENDHSKKNDKERSERRKEKSRLSADRSSKKDKDQNEEDNREQSKRRGSSVRVDEVENSSKENEKRKSSRREKRDHSRERADKKSRDRRPPIPRDWDKEDRRSRSR